MSGDEEPAVDKQANAQEPHISRLRRLTGSLVVAAVVAAASLAIYRQRHAVNDALSNVGVGAMIASFAAAVAGVAVIFCVWREVLCGLELDMPWKTASRVFFVSQLGKYLPGSAWPVLMQMEAGRAQGAARRTMLAANLITIVLSCAVGLTFACILLPVSDALVLSRYWWLALALPGLVALMHPRAMPLLLDGIFVLLRREPLRQRLSLRNSARAAAWSAASFIALGSHLAILAIAIRGGGHRGALDIVILSFGGFALAMCAGVLFIPAPAGAGIRDVVLLVVMRTVLAPGPALAVVVASRAMLIIADLTLAGVAATVRRRTH